MSDISTIAVIGAGQMGGGIAQIAATSGIDAICYDVTSPRWTRPRPCTKSCSPAPSRRARWKTPMPRQR